MLSRIGLRTTVSLAQVQNTLSLRSFASTKEGIKKLNWKITVLSLVGVSSIAVAYCYLEVPRFRDNADNKVLCHIPKVCNLLKRWFPVEFTSSFVLQVVL